MFKSIGATPAQVIEPRLPKELITPITVPRRAAGYSSAAITMLIAHSPIARGAVLDDPVLREIAGRRQLSVAQVALRWLVQQERVVAIPGVQNVEQLRENLKVLDVTLTQDEMAAIGALARGTRIVNPPHSPAWDSA